MADQKTSWFKRHKILTVFGALVLVGIIATAAGSGTDSKTTGGTSSDNKKESTAQAAKVGDAVRDGKFEFTVQSIECGKSSVGASQYLTKTAQGQYCLLKVSIKNIGDEKQSLLSSNQYLYNASGQKYSADDTATIYNSPNTSSSWYNDINPGNSVNGEIVFDLPKDQTPTSAELHDSAFSNGVKVNL
jgi:hypothetical protein